jgi:hypothetical protein
MGVWTISAQSGTPGLEVAAELAARADAAFFDRKALEPIVHQLNPDLGNLDDVEGRFGGRLSVFSLAVAMTYGAPGAFREFELRRTLPELGRKVMHEVARNPAVVLASGAAFALADHPSAIHARLWAPVEWRVAACARTQMVSKEKAAHAVPHADHVEHTWIRALFDVRVDDPALYTVFIDASRLSPDRIVDLLLAAAGR